MKLTDKQLASRVASSAFFQRYRRKIHNLRRLTAGDISALDGAGGASSQENEMSSRYKPGQTELYDLLVTDIEEGRSNKLLQSVRTLTLQVTMRQPEAAFEDLDTTVAAFNTLYLKQITEKCSAEDVFKMGLVDYFIGGLGCFYVGLKDGSPCIDWVDALDVTWDLTAPTFNQIQFGSRVIRLPMYQWLEMFPGNKKLTQLRGNNEDEDIPVAVACYHDITKGSPNEAYFLLPGEGSQPTEEDLIERTSNQYVAVSGGTMKPCVPLVFMNYLNLPSVKNSTSMVEMMLPAQIALWESDRAIRDAMQVGKATREMEEGAYTEDSLEAWKDDPNEILVRKPGKMPMAVSGSVDINSSTLQYRNNAESEVVAQSGVNPYASGGTVKGTEYAAEVNAIQGNAGLMAGAVAKDVADVWRKIYSRVLAVGAQFDDNPITLNYKAESDDLPLEFDENNPIKEYLQPNARIAVSEDNVAYKSKDQKIQSALADVELGAKLPMFPQFLPMALEEYLRVRDKKNISAWLQPPVMPAMGMGMPDMTQGQGVLPPDQVAQMMPQGMPA